MEAVIKTWASLQRRAGRILCPGHVPGLQSLRSDKGEAFNGAGFSFSHLSHRKPLMRPYNGRKRESHLSKAFNLVSVNCLVSTKDCTGVLLMLGIGCWCNRRTLEHD